MVSSMLGDARLEKWSAERLFRKAAIIDPAGYRYPPVNVVGIANFLGIEVYSNPTLKEEHGIIVASFVETKDKSPMIIFEESLSKEFWRFAVAHSIGHLILHPDTRVHTSADFNGSDMANLEANSFAAELIIPSDMISALIGRLTRSQLAKAFNVSSLFLRTRLDRWEILHK